MPAPTCPSRNVLDLFQAGDLEESAIVSVASHVESCPTCQRSLETIIGDSTDTVLSALLAEPVASPFAVEAACRDVLQRVAGLADQSGSGEKPLAPTISLRAAPTPADDEGLPLETIREYKLLAKLGEGGMGAVYKALHTRLEKVVALKVLPEGRMRDSGSVARFQREMKAVGRLDHPNIVRAMDAGEEDGTHFLVMEYVEGVDLSLLAKNIGPLPVADACELVRQAAIGLQEAHEHGMVHRDIKPSNLILANSPRKKSPPTLKILDLGLALLSEGLAPDQGLTSTGQMMGTIDYMAPEQGSDTHHVDIRADIYSLGATLYRLLTGSAPFTGEKFDTPVKKILALATKEAAAVQTLRADVRPALAAIVHKMLAKDPAQRFATPEELAEALAPFCQGANLAALLERGASPGQHKTSTSEIPTHPHLSSGFADTAPTSLPPLPLGEGRGEGDSSPYAPRAGMSAHGVSGLLTAARRKLPHSVAIAAASGGVALAVLLGVVFYLQTSQGTTIRIEIVDPAIKVVLDENSATFEGIDKVHQIKVEPGKHGLAITRGTFKFNTDKFELRKGETLRLSVTYLEGEVRVARADGEPLKVVSATLPASAPSSASATGYALEFNGKDSYVDLPTLRYDGSHPITIEAKIRPGRENAGSVMTALWLGLFSDNFIVGSTGSASSVSLVQSPEQKNAIHLAAVVDESVICLYLNGKLQGNRTLNRAYRELVESNQVNRGFMIGANGEIGSAKPGEARQMRHPLDGIVDEVRISKVARYTADFTPDLRFEPDVDTLALYHFDEGQGDVLKDSSGNNHHGKIFGAKWVREGDNAIKSIARWQGWPKDAPAPAISPFDAKQARKHQEEWAEFLGVPVEYANSIGMKFVLIPPGEYLMGSPATEVNELVKAWDANDTRGPICIKSATPHHRVILTRPAYASVHEVTQKDYQTVMDSNPSVFAKTSETKELAEKVAGMDTADFAVDSVSWLDATDFCSALSRREKLEACYSRVENKVTLREANGYRLPSEAEWEFGCRAGSITPYSVGDEDADLLKAGWFSGNSGGRRHAVGELQSNPFGLYDLHGNAWEWVQDWWEPSYPEPMIGQPAVNPQNESLTGKSERVLRGGNWRGIASLCRSSFRDARDYWHRHQDYGFRVWLSVDAVKAAIGERKSVPVARDREANGTVFPAYAAAPLHLVKQKEDYANVRAELDLLQKSSKQNYHVVILQTLGDYAPRGAEYLSTLAEQWRQETAQSQTPFDAERLVIIVMSINDQHLEIYFGPKLKDGLGLEGPPVTKELLVPYFLSYAQQGKLSEGLVSLLRGTEKWIADREATKDDKPK